MLLSNHLNIFFGKLITQTLMHLNLIFIFHIIWSDE